MNFLIDKSEKLKQAIDICFDSSNKPQTTDELLEDVVRQDNHTFIKVTILLYVKETISQFLPELDLRKDQPIPKQLIAQYTSIKRSSKVKLPMRVLTPFVFWSMIINILISLTFVISLLVSKEHSTVLLLILDHISFYPIVTIPVIIIMFIAKLTNPIIPIYKLETTSLHGFFVEIIKLNLVRINGSSTESFKELVTGVYYNQTPSRKDNSLDQINWCLSFVKENDSSF